MERIECINGLDYDKVMFRNEIANFIRHSLKTEIDYIQSIDIHPEGGYIVNYMIRGELMSFYDKHNWVARRIDEFYKIEIRDTKLNQIGI